MNNHEGKGMTNKACLCECYFVTIEFLQFVKLILLVMVALMPRAEMISKNPFSFVAYVI